MGCGATGRGMAPASAAEREAAERATRHRRALLGASPDATPAVSRALNRSTVCGARSCRRLPRGHVPMPNTRAKTTTAAATPFIEPIASYLDANGTYICTAYNPRCFVIQKVRSQILRLAFSLIFCYTMLGARTVRRQERVRGVGAGDRAGGARARGWGRRGWARVRGAGPPGPLVGVRVDLRPRVKSRSHRAMLRSIRKLCPPDSARLSTRSGSREGAAICDAALPGFALSVSLSRSECAGRRRYDVSGEHVGGWKSSVQGGRCGGCRPRDAIFRFAKDSLNIAGTLAPAPEEFGGERAHADPTDLSVEKC